MVLADAGGPLQQQAGILVRGLVIHKDDRVLQVGAVGFDMDGRIPQEHLGDRLVARWFFI